MKEASFMAVPAEADLRCGDGKSYGFVLLAVPNGGVKTEKVWLVNQKKKKKELQKACSIPECTM